jgi:hypothetical protein
MFFKVKPKVITVDCFTPSHTAATICYPSKASKYIPQWWKDIPNKVSTYDSGIEIPELSIKKCKGIIDYYSVGWILPLNTEVAIEVSKEFGVKWVHSSDEFFIQSHGNHQSNYKFLLDYVNIKFCPPWKIREKTGVKFILTCPKWNFAGGLPLRYPPGIIDFKYQNSCNVNTFVKLEDTPYKIELDLGMPIAHFTPLADPDVKIDLKIHQISQEEYGSISKGINSVWSDRWRKFKRVLDINESK